MGFGSDELKIKTVLETILDERGFKQFQDGVEAVKHKSREGAQEVGRLGESFAELRNHLLAAFTAVGLFEFFKNGLEEYAKTERALGGLRAQLRSLGQDTEETWAKVDHFTASMRDLYKIDEGDLIPSLNRLVLVTGDVASSMGLAEIALRFARSGMVSQQEALAGVSALMQGSSRAAKLFGVDIKELAEGGFSFSKALDAIIAKMNGLGDVTPDTQSALDEVTATLKNAGEVGGAALVALAHGFKEVLYYGADAIEYLDQKWTEWTGKTLISPLSGIHAWTHFYQDQAAEMKTLVDQGNILAAQRLAREKDVDRALAKVEEDFGKQTADLAAMRTTADVKQAQARIQVAKEEAKAKLEALKAAAGTDPESVKKAEEVVAAFEAGLKKMGVEAVKEAQDRAKKVQAIEMESARQVLEAHLSVAKDGSEEQKAALLDRLEFEREEAVRNAREVGADVVAVQNAFEAQKTAILLKWEAAREAAYDKEFQAWKSKFDAEQRAFSQGMAKRLQIEKTNHDKAVALEEDLFEVIKKGILSRAALEGRTLTASFAQQKRDLQRWLAQEVHLHQHNAAALVQILRTYSAASKQIAKEEALAKAAYWEEYAQQVLGALTTIFGENKATAIAGAIINTAQGVTKAMADPGGYAGLVLAIIIAAAGAAQIAKIRSTNPGGGSSSSSGRGSGFDDPLNDEIARRTGQKWADDAMERLTAGFWKSMAGHSFSPPGGRGESGHGPTIINERNTTFAPQNTFNVPFHGWVGGSRTEVAKQMKRDLDRIDRQVVSRSRVRG